MNNELHIAALQERPVIGRISEGQIVKGQFPYCTLQHYLSEIVFEP
jgi:hypothetical protein